MSGAEYPKALYRDGGDDLIWGKPVRTIAVHSPGEEAERLAEGWRRHPEPGPLDHDGNGHPGGSLPRRGRPPKMRTETNGVA